MLLRATLRKLPGFRRLFKALEDAELDNRNLKKEIDCLQKTIKDFLFYQGKTGNKEPGAYSSGMPIPPEVLRYLVAGTPDLDWFMSIGLEGARVIQEVVSKYFNGDIAKIRIHDFGCGCGRVAGHLSRVFPGRLSGSDGNITAVQWCSENIPNAVFFGNGLIPPLDLETASVDLLFAYSVFTHLTLDNQEIWKKEIVRVLKPKTGLLVISLHGDSSLASLTQEEYSSYRAGELVVRNSSLEGSNFCATFHPKPYAIKQFGEVFNLLEHLPGGSRGTPPQDLYIFQCK